MVLNDQLLNENKSLAKQKWLGMVPKRVMKETGEPQKEGHSKVRCQN